LFTPLGIGGLVVLALALGALAGAAPAISLAYADSARVLAGGGAVARRRAGRQRFIVVAAQYAVSIGLGALTLIGFLQVRHMREAALGYDPRGLVIVRDDAANSEDLLAALRAAPGVRGVSMGSNGPNAGERNEESMRFAEGEALNIQRIEVAHGFFQAYRARLLAGTLLSGDTRDEIVVNESAARAAGLSAAQLVGRHVHISGAERRIVGVVRDIRFGGLREPGRPVYYMASARAPIIAVSVESVSDSAALGVVRDIWRRYRPDAPIEARTADEAIVSGYAADRRRNRVLAAFTVVALLLASFGAYALSAYAAERSGREMAIRRVVGADGWAIAALHVRRGVAPALLGALLAAPVTFILSERWLSGFDARIQLTPLYIFLVVIAALLMAALASVREAVALAREPPGIRLRSG
jgi:putative ABC transport system permease protein